jgi:riboflavin transporter FmnP
MEINTKLAKQLAIYSLGIGLAYLVFGLLELTRGLSEAFSLEWAINDINTAIVYPDMFSGITLAIIGAIFLFGIKTQWKAQKDAASYLAVGTLIAAVFCAVYLAIMGAHALGAGIYHIAPETYADIFADWAEWTWLDDMRAGIWLFIFALPGAYYTVKMWRSRKKKP